MFRFPRPTASALCGRDALHQRRAADEQCGQQAVLLDFVALVVALSAFVRYRCVTSRDYRGLIGGYFDVRPWRQAVRIEVVDPADALVAFLDDRSRSPDEIYRLGDFDDRGSHVLLRLDEASVDLDGVERRPYGWPLSPGPAPTESGACSTLRWDTKRPCRRIRASSACCSTASAGPCDGFHHRDHAPARRIAADRRMDESGDPEGSYDVICRDRRMPRAASLLAPCSVVATVRTHAQPARLSECGKSQKRLAARRASRTAPETAVVATILIRLCAAIDSVEDPCAKVRFVFAFLRFDFCDARIAFPRRWVRLLGSLTLTLSLSSVCPRSANHHGMASNLNA